MGGNQLGGSDYALTGNKKPTKHEKFPVEMEAVVPGRPERSD
jgi:hypothetical protein